jgi:hypothetical protein
MANLQHLINGARKATGDDTIDLAGLFEPKGTAAKEGAGAIAGSVIGDAAGSQAIGTSVGLGVGMAASADHGQIRFVLALSPEKIYVLKPEHFDSLHKEELELLHTFDRKTARVTVHARVTVRTIVIENEEGRRVELEGDRMWFKHSKAVVQALLEDHFEGEESALEDAPAPA